jgi:polyhydroxyalkanoate synthesis regulator phasin
MAERDNDSGGVLDAAEQLALAAVGAVSLTAERADQLANELAERGGMRRDEARAFVRDLVSRWRGDAVRVGERTGAGLQGPLRQLGLVLRAEHEELELRVAQLEHRLRLLERDEATTAIQPPRAGPSRA